MATILFIQLLNNLVELAWRTIFALVFCRKYYIRVGLILAVGCP